MANSKLIFQPLPSEKQIRKHINPTFFQEVRGYLVYFLEVFISVAVVYIVVRTSIFDIISISGKSMYPTFDDKDAIYIDMVTPRFSDYRRGDVVVLVAPKECEPSQSLFIKRIVGLPGDKMIFEDGKVYLFNPELGDQPILLDEKGYLKTQVKTHKNIVSPGPRFEEEVLSQNEYFVMGDNRTASLDSRRCGKITKDIILGKEFYRILPTEKQGFYKLPKYNITN